MNILFWGLGLFATAFLLHLVAWRIHAPQRQRRILFLLYTGFLLIALVLLALGGGRLGVGVPSHLAEYILISVLYMSLALDHIVFSVALEGDSPTLYMAKRINDTGSEGFPENRFAEAVRLDRWLHFRLRLMVVDKMTSCEAGCYRITDKGRRLLRFYAAYGKLSGMQDRSV